MRTQRKTIAFLPAHPAQLWMLRPVADAVSDFAEIVWVLRDKDCTIALADSLGLEYTVISRAAQGLVGNALELAGNIFRAYRITRQRGVDLWVTKYGAANIAAFLARRISVSFNDDDADVVPVIAWTSYPFARLVLAPQVTRMGRFAAKTLFYPAYHELFYLHPNRFTPDNSVFQELGLSPDAPFAIVRLSALHSHHDAGARGMDQYLLREIMRLADTQEAKIRVFISSEKPLTAEFEPHRFSVAPERMHHALAFAEFFVGDSQTMTAEAAVLGTPAFRLNTFVGRISYIEEMQDYGLAFGYQPGREEALLAELQNVLAMPRRRDVFQRRRTKMLSEKIDPVPWMARILRGAAGDASVDSLRRTASAETEAFIQ
ncbi:MAG: hypothetical protein V3W34_01870 [Phycisphaerae bacterium]